jgi:hypothetical protein
MDCFVSSIHFSLLNHIEMKQIVFTTMVLIAAAFLSLRLAAQTALTSQSSQLSQTTAPDSTHLYIDVHHLGAGKVTAAAVAAAHQKDLAVESKYGVNFINYWVDEKNGTVLCLSQAPDSTAIINTHREAHGLIPVSVVKVEQGQ